MHISQIMRMLSQADNSYLHGCIQVLSVEQEISLSAPATTIVGNWFELLRYWPEQKQVIFSYNQFCSGLLDQRWAYFHNNKAKGEYSVRLYTVHTVALFKIL